MTPPGTPAKRALAVLDTPAPAESAGPQKRISAKVRRAIDAMVSGKCKRICDAAERVGLARESLSRALSTPHVAQLADFAIVVVVATVETGLAHNAAPSSQVCRHHKFGVARLDCAVTIEDLN